MSSKVNVKFISLIILGLLLIMLPACRNKRKNNSLAECKKRCNKINSGYCTGYQPCQTCFGCYPRASMSNITGPAEGWEPEIVIYRSSE